MQVDLERLSELELKYEKSPTTSYTLQKMVDMVLDPYDITDVKNNASHAIALNTLDSLKVLI